MNTLAASNPYHGATFLDFLSVLMQRIAQFLTGGLSLENLASDEIQMLVLLGLAVSSAFVGTFLVLRQMTMLANALCHTILLGIVLSFVLLTPFMYGQVKLDASSTFLSLKMLIGASLLSGLLTTVLSQFLINVAKLQEDASVGLVFTTLFALGVVLVTVFTRNMHLGTEAIMGNIDALDVDDLRIVFSLALCNVIVFLLFFKEFKATTFDPSFSSAAGISTHFFNYFLMVLTAATSIAAFRAVGVLLVLAFFVGPVLMARLLTDRLKILIMLAFATAGGGSLIGVALSRHLLSVYGVPLSTAGLVVTVLTAFYFLLLIFAPRRGAVFRIIKTFKAGKSPINIDT